MRSGSGREVQRAVDSEVVGDDVSVSGVCNEYHVATPVHSDLLRIAQGYEMEGRQHRRHVGGQQWGHAVHETREAGNIERAVAVGDGHTNGPPQQLQSQQRS